jgi:hypothetical protein
MPRSVDEWMCLRPDFGVPDEDRLDISFSSRDAESMSKVVETAEKVTAFCEEHSVDSKTAYYYIFNTDCSEKKHITLTVNDNVRAELWDAFKYSKEKLACRYENGQTSIDITLTEGGNALICTEKTYDIQSSSTLGKCTVSVLPISPEFDIRRNDPNVLLMEYCSFKREGGEYGDEYPILAVQQILVEENYHGKLTQKFTFRTDFVIKGLKIALEDAAEHTILMNGIPVEVAVDGYYRAKAFETVSLPDSIIGTNTIEITRDFVPLAKIRRNLESLHIQRGNMGVPCVGRYHQEL